MFDSNRLTTLLADAEAALPDPASVAEAAIGLLDLTSLNDDDDVSGIQQLCSRAITPVGPVAAVCVYPKFVKTGWETLPNGSGVQVATVVNFPSGSANPQRAADQTADAVAMGADEIDVVFPYEAYLAGDAAIAKELVEACKAACGSEAKLKVILETGAFDEPAKIYEASVLCIQAGADFIKTSTGKIAAGASPEAAAAMALAIADSNAATGLKISGGVRTAEDAARYLAIAKLAWQRDTLPGSDTFRFGASGLLTALLNTLDKGDGSAQPTSGY